MAEKIDRVISSGATLMLGDGSMWNIPFRQDREKTRLWQPQEEVEPVGMERLRYRLENLSRGETVTAERLK
ncbi:MAG: hypothetical protein P8Z70_04850 [Desulfuromonadales bacterium]|jgi:hypothetical protein